MTFASIDKKLYVLAAVALCAAMIAAVLATAAPGAVAASRWLSLPGFALPGWAPLAAAAAGVVLVHFRREAASFALLLVALAVSVAMVTVCVIALA